MSLELRAEVIDSLNLQYKTRNFQPLMTPKDVILCAEEAMRANIDVIDYELNGDMIARYGIKTKYCEVSPFPEEQENRLAELAQLIDSLIKAAKQTSAIVNNILQKIKDYVVKHGLGVKIVQRYHKYALFFKRINIKEALIFQSLSKCQVFYTIKRERKKSGKEFYMDPLIDCFETIRAKLEITSNPFHESILPKKQLRVVEKKNTDKKMKNTLFDAVSSRKYKEVRELIVRGASLQEQGIVERTKREMCCSHRACQLGDLQMCRILHSFNVNWEAREKQGMTPFHFAVQSGSLDLVRFLVQEAKVNIEAKDIQERTSFYFACTEGDMNIIRYLQERGIDINNKSKLGRSALSKACYLGLIEVVDYLLNLPGINPSIADSKGRTALHNAVFGPKGGREGHKFGTNQKDSPQCTQLLLERGFDIDYPDKELNTALHVSMSSDGKDSINVLLAFGASLTKLNCYQETPLMTGSKFGHLDSVKHLKENHGASLLGKDIFGKNIMLLCAKFRQDDGKNVNQVFYYATDELLAMAKRNEPTGEGKNSITDWDEEIDYTFTELLKETGRVKTEFVYFANKCKEYGLSVHLLTLQHIKLLLEFVKGSENQGDFDIVEYFVSTRPQSSTLLLKKQQFTDFLKWIIFENSNQTFEFFFTLQPKLRNYLKIEGNEYFTLHDYLSSITFTMMSQMKEKVLTYCLLKLNVNWLDFIDEEHYYNILHLLVRHKKVGSLIQILKILSGVKMNFITNQHVINLLDEEQGFRNGEEKGQSPLQLVLRNMLIHKDRDGFDPYHLALLVKDASAAKILEEKVNKEGLMNNQHFEVKDYAILREEDPVELQLFNKGYELEEELNSFSTQIETMNSQQQLSKYFCIFREASVVDSITDIDNFKSVWKDIQHRKVHYIHTVDEVSQLIALQSAKILGIDIEYFYSDGATLISIMQISSLNEDYIIDFLSSAKHHQSYLAFITAVRHILTPIAYNPQIMKVMHGSDNDLCVIKSVLKFSFLNFVDTARIDVELRKQQNIRGLAALVKEYLGEHMNKDYQVSEWRIRPIPSSMLDYARRDSLVLPFLVRKMLATISPPRLTEILLASCRHARRNRKTTQPLIKSIQCL